MKRFFRICYKTLPVLSFVLALGAWGYLYQQEAGFRGSITDLTGYTGNIGAEDVEFGTPGVGVGNEETFSTPTHTGVNQTLTKIYDSHIPIISQAARYVGDFFGTSYTVIAYPYDLITRGPWVDIRAYPTPADAVTAIGSSKKRLLVPTQQTITANLAFNANTTVVAYEDAFLIANGITVTVNGKFMAGNYRVKTGNGTLVFAVGSVSKFNPQWVGAVGDGTTNSTAAFAEIISSMPSIGGDIEVPPGVYLFDDVTLPAYPKVVNLDGGASVFRPYSANTRLFGASTNDVRMGKFGNFTIQAHAGGSTGEAIDMMNMRGTAWSGIGWLSNGAGNFDKGVKLIASTYGCYGNVLERFWVYGQTGPTTLIDFQNGNDANANANANTIRGFFVQGCTTGMTTVINGVRSAQVEVSGCTLQGNTLAIAIIPGDTWNIHDNWFELNSGVDIDPQTVTGGESNSVRLHDNKFFGGSTLTLDGNLRGWKMENNVPDTNLTIVDTSATVTNLIQRGGVFESANVQGRIVWHNIATGGGNWAWLFTATGGPFPGALVLMDVDNTKYPFSVAANCPVNLLSLEATGVRLYEKDLTLIESNKGIVMNNTTYGGVRRCRLNDTGNGWIFEAP